MQKPEPTLADLQQAFRSHGVEPPAAYAWIVAHRLIGFEDASPLEPWHLCTVGEIMPLGKRWRKIKVGTELIPFARDQRGDDLACFDVDKQKVIRVCEIHYDLGPPVYVEIGSKYETIWDWLRGALDDAKRWAEMKR